jgi:hypothetical protein
MVVPDAVPSWVSAQADSTWGIVPMANTIASIDAKNNPDLNPNYPNNSYWSGVGGISAICYAWCGWTADTVDNEFISVLNGGHTDYGGNELVAVNLNSNTPSYELRRPPSGTKNATYPNGFVVNDGVAAEATGLYADGYPRSVHSYNKHVFVPDVGLVVGVLGNSFYSATVSNNSTAIIDPKNGDLKYFGGSFIHAGAGTSGLGVCYDSTRNVIWAKAVGTSKFSRRSMANIASAPWSEFGSNSIDGSSYSGLEYIPDGDFIICIRNGKVWVFNPTSGALLDITASISGALVGTVWNGTMQPRYIGGNKIAVWDNSSNTTQINILQWVSSPFTATNWSVAQLPVAAGNSVTPTAKTTNGTYGRFAYFPKLRIFTLINETNQSMYFYKLAA